MNAVAPVGVVGDGPAVDAVVSAVGDSDHDAAHLGVEEIDTVQVAVVVATAGDDRFSQVDATRSEPWLAVELGGIGGRAIEGVEAGVSVLAGAGPCYRCLRTRVDSANEAPGTDRPTVDRADARLAGAHAGRLTLRLLDGSEEVGTVIEFPFTRRTLIAVPNCTCEGTADPDLDLSHASQSLETAVEWAEDAVDPRFGPVTSIGEAESFPAPYYLASLVDTTGFSDVQASRQAAGVAAEWNPAFMKAVGEALERYSAGVYRSTDFPVGSATTVENPVPADRFVRPDEGYDDPEPGDDIQWIQGRDLSADEPVHLPAERVTFPPTEERLAPAITTGLGLGTSGADALVAGLTEVIERDATMIGWYSTFEPLGLSVDDPDYDTLVSRARSEGLEVTVLLMTQDVDIPVVTAAVHRDENWPQFAVGSGAALRPEDAAIGAVEEALQNWIELRGMGVEGAKQDEPRVARYADGPPAVQTFIDVEETIPAVTVGSKASPSGADVFPALLERVESAGLDAYAARLTPRDVESIGFEAVRVLVPEAQPLFTGDRFFGDRARSVPRELGFRPRLDRPPHPYP